MYENGEKECSSSKKCLDWSSWQKGWNLVKKQVESLIRSLVLQIGGWKLKTNSLGIKQQRCSGGVVYC